MDSFRRSLKQLASATAGTVQIRAVHEPQAAISNATGNDLGGGIETSVDQAIAIPCATLPRLKCNARHIARQCFLQ